MTFTIASPIPGFVIALFLKEAAPCKIAAVRASGGQALPPAPIAPYSAG